MLNTAAAVKEMPKLLVYTPEFILYGILYLYLHYEMFCFALKQSDKFLTGERPVFEGMQPGWMMNRLQDLSDPQFASFRSNFFKLASFAALHVLLGRLVGTTPSRRILYNIAFGLVFVVYCFESKALFVLGVFIVNYFVGQFGVVPTWIFNLLILFSSKILGGYHFSAIGLPFLDEFVGSMEWQTSFNISLCRLISFNCDRIWARRNAKDSEKVAAQQELAKSLAAGSVGASSTRSKVLEKLCKIDLPLSNYSFLNYMGYVLYVPFFIGGPVLPFNSFMWQVRSRQNHYSMKRIALLAAELMGWFFLLELATHLFYYDGVNDKRLWNSTLTDMSAVEIWWAGFFTLHFMWTKFMVIWRFFRVWGLLDGTDSPENMERWIHNNHTFQGFWRGWHSSLNKWIVRYLYVPLGGKRTQQWSMWVIFTFVGIWHDLWWRWVAWAWFNAVFFSIELILMTFFTKSKKTARIRSFPGWRQFTYLVGALNIIFLVISNLAIPHGFHGSYQFITRSFFSEGGAYSLGFTLFYYYISAAFQNEYAKWEEMTEDSASSKAV
eukprot:ANDGO_02805.mRNA.1 Putative membrane-bound O-acyltransferase C24H6.01c